MKTKFLLLASLFLGLHITYAQTDTLYIKQGGFTIDKFNTSTQVDSLIYYHPTTKAVTNDVYVMKGGVAVKKFNTTTELDSIIFYRPIDEKSNWPSYEKAAQSEFSPNVLVVLLDFSNTDVNTELPDSENKWAQLIFGKNQAQGNHYWYLNSGGQVQLKPAAETNGTANNGVVKFKLSVPRPTSAVKPQDQTWFKDALNALTSSVNFASFDANNDDIITDKELSVLFIINIDWSLIDGAEAVANIRLNHTISGTGKTLENFTRSTFRQSSIGVPMHELGHHFLELNHFASPSDHGLMGLGAYAQDPVIPMLTSAWRSGTRPTGLMGHTAIFGGLLTPTTITETTLGVKLHAPEKGLLRNIIKIPVKDGELYIENRTKWNYDQSIPFCEGDEGGIFFTEASQYVMPLNIPAIQRDLNADNFAESEYPFCEYYAYAGHNDNFEYGGWRFENISVAGGTMTLDIIKLNTEPTIDHYKIVYWEIDPTRDGYRRKAHKRIDIGITPNMNLAETYNGSSTSTIHPLWIDAYYTTGESRNLNATATLNSNTPYVYVYQSGPGINEGAFLASALLNIRFNTSKPYTPTATISISNGGSPIGNFIVSNVPSP